MVNTKPHINISNHFQCKYKAFCIFSIYSCPNQITHVNIILEHTTGALCVFYTMWDAVLVEGFVAAVF